MSRTEEFLKLYKIGLNLFIKYQENFLVCITNFE